MTGAGPAAGAPRTGRGTLGQRARVALIRAASWVACRLPERVAVALADVAGGVWYRVAPARAEQGRRNFARLARHLAAEGRGPDRARAAARDAGELERLVRLAFRHDARYYLEILRMPELEPAFLDERVVVETPAEIDEAFAGGAVIFVSAHFGPIELPALYLAHRSGSTFVAPMETVDDPPLQAWFEETRGSLGVRIVGLRSARRELSAALKAGGYAGIVGDRDIGGGGIEVPFFGSPAPFPIGPALLAMETGARIAAVGVRRLPDGRVAGRLTFVPVAAEGTRRERIAATLAALAAALEAFIGDAPEQWSGAFFEIWPDLAAVAAPPRASGAPREPGSPSVPGAPGEEPAA